LEVEILRTHEAVKADKTRLLAQYVWKVHCKN